MAAVPDNHAVRHLQRILTCAFLFLGCFGYSTHSLLPPHIKTVALADVGNSTTRPGLAEDLTTALLRAFASDRSLRITSIDKADLIVSVNVNSYSRSPSVYDASQSISGYDIAIGANVSAKDAVRDEEFFAGSVLARSSYNPDSRDEDTAVQEAVAKLASEIVRQMVSTW
uniref:Lipopolysaccharide-assembly n=1 Tax=candidate division WOR-3 bacterium TaxID=2052148 RepID=A0A7C4G9V2_UNCW3